MGKKELLLWQFSGQISLESVRLTTVQPKNNARARSAARASCAVRTRNLPQEVKMSFFCGLPARTFETQEVESLTARSRKKLKI